MVSRCKFGSVVLPGMRVLPELLSVVVDLGSMIAKDMYKNCQTIQS